MDLFSLVIGKVIAGNGGGASSGAALNIAYGDTASADTSKLWIKANKPESIAFGSDFEGVESIETIGNIPTAGYGMGCAKVGTKIYLFGGQSASSVYLDTINVFDTEIQTITTLETTLPIACSNIACASVGSKIYLFGGYNGDSLDTISVFDTETQIITILSTILPTACNSIYCASIGNKVYLLGGSNSLNTINVFDTETQIITQLSTKLPVTYSGRGYASVGSKIYLFGGYYYSMGAAYSNRIDVFDTETQTITQLSTKLPAARYSIACTNVGNKIYLFGGRNKNTHNTIFVFDASTETITTSETTLPTVCYSMSCASVGNKIYLFGGYDSNYFNTINQFSLTHDLTENNIEIITAYKNFFNVINTDTMKVEIGVDSVLIGDENNQAKVCEAYLHNGTDWQRI